MKWLKELELFSANWMLTVAMIALAIWATAMIAPQLFGQQVHYVDVSWSGGSGKANLYKATGAAAEVTTPIATNLTGTTYRDSAVVAGQSYSYTMTSVLPDGTETPHSIKTSCTVPNDVLPPTPSCHAN